jgi:hypothetical protein
MQIAAAQYTLAQQQIHDHAARFFGRSSADEQ